MTYATPLPLRAALKLYATGEIEAITEFGDPVSKIAAEALAALDALTAENAALKSRKPVYSEERTAHAKEIAALTAEHDGLRAALEELVAIRDLERATASLAVRLEMHDPVAIEQFHFASENIARREPRAWAAARLALNLPTAKEG